MASSQVSNRSLKPIVGKVLLAAGLVFLLVFVGSLALQFESLFRIQEANTLGLGATMGMALFRTLQAVAFEHSLLFSVLTKILVSFSAFVVAMAGAALLRSQSAQPTKATQSSSAGYFEGDR